MAEKVIFLNERPVGYFNDDEEGDQVVGHRARSLERTSHLNVNSRGRRERTVSVPGQEPEPDEQGNVPTCTRYALSKAACAGFQREIFVVNTIVDFEQKYITKILKR